MMCLQSSVINYYYEHCSGSCSGNDNTGKKEYAVKFNAAINKIASVSRASVTTPLQKNRYVTLYTFQSLADEISEINYTTNESGILSPVQGELSLPEGTYDFYALSIGNAPSYPPTANVDNGFTTALSNGIDYLTCVNENVVINGPATVDLVFNHVSSQVMVIIKSNSSTTVIDSIYSATISQPETTATAPFIDLYTGYMSSVRALSATPISMAITDSLCQQILVPLKLQGNLTMEFAVYVNGASKPMSYEIAIPLVNGALESGSSYEYLVLVTEDDVNIATASVNPWTDVNETGTPLYPTPQ